MSGGKQKGAPKTGGRQKGSKNKTTRALEAEIAASGETPRDYMLRVMRDAEAETVRRDAMAKAAAPYVHPTFASVRHSGDEDNPVKIERIERVIIDPEDRNRKGVPPAA